MKQLSSTETTARVTAETADRSAGAGPGGATIAPPAYGMDMLDQPPALPCATTPQVAIQRRVEPAPASPAGAEPENRTGLPDHLKAGIERLSGLPMGDVRVHRNSARPAQLHALAYAQGSDIYVGPGQERHLPHEAWHVAQQKQGRVRPTLQAKGVSINDDQGLEREADVMGARAVARFSPPPYEYRQPAAHTPAGAPPVQRTLKLVKENKTYKKGQFMQIMIDFAVNFPGDVDTDAIEALIEDDDEENVHSFDDLDALIKSVRVNVKVEQKEDKKKESMYKKDNKNEDDEYEDNQNKKEKQNLYLFEVGKEKELSIDSIIDRMDNNTIKVEEGQKLNLIGSQEKSSQPLYNVNINKKDYLLKREPDNKSEFLGMKKMAANGIAVPSTILVTMSDGQQYMLMEYIKGLGAGLAYFNKMDSNMLYQASYELGILHVTDIQIGNVDRLPWRGNQNTGHLYNVFSSILTGRLIGIDSEYNEDFTKKHKEIIKLELEDIGKNPKKYAEQMLQKLMNAGKDKLMLEKQKPEIFIKGFADGLQKAL